MARTWQDAFLTPNGATGAAPETEEAQEERRGFFRRLRQNLSRSREALAGEMRATFTGPLDDETWERLEEALIYADVGARTTAKVVERLEREIDAMNVDLAPLTSFILPSGSQAVGSLHLARAIVRRAERSVVALHEREPLNPQLLAFINRLSDHLFVAARFVAAKGDGDVLWVPGASRQ